MRSTSRAPMTGSSGEAMESEVSSPLPRPPPPSRPPATSKSDGGAGAGAGATPSLTEPVEELPSTLATEELRETGPSPLKP